MGTHRTPSATPLSVLCLSVRGKKYQCHFHRRLHHRYPAVWIKTLGKDGSTVS